MKLTKKQLSNLYDGKDLILLNNLTKLDPKINPNFVRDEGKKNDTQSK